MKKYEILEHKADLKIRVFGATKQKLFENALFGMQECMKPGVKKPERKTKRDIEIKSMDLLSLLVDFLSEVLYLIQVNREIYTDVKFIKFSDTEIKAELFGKKAERFGEDIKAVTYHQLDVLQKKDGTWQTTIIFDI